MNVVQAGENTLGIAKFCILQIFAGPVSKLLNFMIVTFNVLKLCLFGIPQQQQLHEDTNCFKSRGEMQLQVFWTISDCASYSVS